MRANSAIGPLFRSPTNGRLDTTLNRYLIIPQIWYDYQVNGWAMSRVLTDAEIAAILAEPKETGRGQLTRLGNIAKRASKYHRGRLRSSANPAESYLFASA